MGTRMTMISWKGEKFWLGKLKEHPQIMTQGRTLKELEENLKNVYLMMVMDNGQGSTPRRPSPYETDRINSTTRTRRMSFTPPRIPSRYLF